MAAIPMVIEKIGDIAGQGILCLHGPLTMENVRPLQNAIRREESSDCVILDLSEVPYVDSSGLGSLVSIYVSRQKAGKRVALAGVNERVFRLFEVTRIESLFPIFDTIEQAVAALSGAAQA